MIDLESRLLEIKAVADLVKDEAGTTHDECIQAAARLTELVDALLADVAQMRRAA